jgi:hypothetical protein
METVHRPHAQQRRRTSFEDCGEEAAGEDLVEGGPPATVDH